MFVGPDREERQRLHLLPCSVIARTVKDFAGSVKLVNGKQQANAKSPMDMILLGATMGTELTLVVEVREPKRWPTS